MKKKIELFKIIILIIGLIIELLMLFILIPFIGFLVEIKIIKLEKMINYIYKLEMYIKALQKRINNL